MNLKTKLESTVCFIRNGEYKVLSQKLKKIDTDVLKKIFENTTFLDDLNPKLVDRVKYILQNRTTTLQCNHCSKSMLKLNGTFCSTKCNNNSEQTKSKFRDAYMSLTESEKLIRNEKRKDTFNAKYGGYTFEVPQLRQKVKTTMVEKYGVEHSFHNAAIKQKAVNTWLSAYGTDNPRKASEIKEKIKSVLQNRYGVSNASLVDSDSRVAKIQKTKIERGWIIPDELLSDYQLYRKAVRRLTEKTYKEYKDTINPARLERVTNGKNGYQLDHKYSVLEGFLNDVDPKLISHRYNLQMLPWNENRQKSKKCSITLEQLKTKTQKL